MKKLIRTSLNNVANKRGVRDLNIQLYSHDKNNAGFEFVIKNEVDLSEYKAKVLFDFQETFATWETTGTIEGNVVKVKFDTTFITKCEEVIGYLFLDSETDTLDVFKFKFNVVLSEIDKYDMAKRGFRYIKDQEVVDVITRSELEEEIKKLQVNGGIDLSNYLTTSVASETYAKKTDLPAPYNDSALVERVTNLENKTPVDLTNYALKTEIPQPYNDSELVQKIGQLEARVDMDIVYDDTNIKERLTNLENKPTVDASNFVTNEALEEKHYVTNEQISSTYATKSEIPQPYSDTELVKRITVLENKQDNDTIYDDTDIKNRIQALENRPTTGGTQIQDTGWITISDDDSLHGNVVKIRRINDMVHVSLSNPNSEGLQFELDSEAFAVILASKKIGIGFTPLKLITVPVTETENVMRRISDGTNVIGQVVYKVESGKVMINSFGTKFSFGQPLEVLVNDFSYFTEDPFPTNLN